jgi:hypothetical protein
MSSSAASPWPASPVIVQCLGMAVSAAVLLLGVAALAAICTHCQSVSRRCTFAAGVLAIMVALPAWIMVALPAWTVHIAFRP